MPEKERPSWLKSSKQAAEKSVEKRAECDLRLQEEKAAFESTLADLRSRWNFLNVNGILQDLSGFLHGSNVRVEESTYRTDHRDDNYYVDGPNVPALKAQIIELYGRSSGYEGQNMRTLFVIQLNARNRFSVGFGEKISKNIGLFENEEKLKESIDKFISSGYSRFES